MMFSTTDDIQPTGVLPIRTCALLFIHLSDYFLRYFTAESYNNCSTSMA